MKTYTKGKLVGEQQLVKEKPGNPSGMTPKHMLIAMSTTRLYSLVKLHLRSICVLTRNLEAVF